MCCASPAAGACPVTMSKAAVATIAPARAKANGRSPAARLGCHAATRRPTASAACHEPSSCAVWTLVFRPAPNRLGTARTSSVSATQRVRSGASREQACGWRPQDRSREIGHRFRRSDAETTVELLDRAGERGASGTARDVSVDHRTLERRDLAVRGRRNRVPDFVTLHVLVVVGAHREFPTPRVLRGG